MCGADIHSADLSVTVSTAAGVWQLEVELGLFTILTIRAAFLSVTVEPNAVCSGPTSAAANNQEWLQLFSAF